MLVGDLCSTMAVLHFCRINWYKRILEIDNDFDICESDTLSMMSESISKISIERLYSSHSK